MKLYGKKSPNLDLIIFKLEDSTIYPLLVPRLLPHVLVFHNGVAQKITYRMMTLLLTEDIFFCAMKYIQTRISAAYVLITVWIVTYYVCN